MTSAQLVNLKGKSVGEVALAEEVFALAPDTGLLHAALTRQLANARAGTAKAKTRAEVSGGGKKPWRQKGTGNARVGSIRSPLWEGGGVIFGPKPRDYAQSMPKKMRQLALRYALAARKDDLVVVKNFSELKDGKTKEMAQALKDLGLSGKKVLLILDRAQEEWHKVQLAGRNIAGVRILEMNDLNVRDLLDCQAVLTAEYVISQLNQRFKAASAKGGDGTGKKARTEEKGDDAAKSARKDKGGAQAEVKSAGAVEPEKPAAKAKAKAEKKSGDEKAPAKTSTGKTAKKETEPAKEAQGKKRTTRKSEGDE